MNPLVFVVDDDAVVVRYDSTGQLDGGFGVGGAFFHDGGSDDFANAVVVQPLERVERRPGDDLGVRDPEEVRVCRRRGRELLPVEEFTLRVSRGDLSALINSGGRSSALARGRNRVFGGLVIAAAACTPKPKMTVPAPPVTSVDTAPPPTEPVAVKPSEPVPVAEVIAALGD